MLGRRRSEYVEGETQCDGEDAELSVKAWNSFTDTDSGNRYIANMDRIHIDNDGMVFGDLLHAARCRPGDAAVGRRPAAARRGRHQPDPAGRPAPTTEIDRARRHRRPRRSTPATDHAGPHRDRRSARPPRAADADARRRPRRRVRDPPAPAHQRRPQADAADRASADDRAPRRAARARAASPTSCSRSGSSPSRSPPRSRTAGTVTSGCTTRSSPSRSTPPGRSRSQRVHAGIDDTFVVANGDIVHRPRRRRARRAPPAARRRRHDPPHPRRRPVGVRRGRGRRRRRRAALRREAGTGRDRLEPDQRRHLRARAVACST